jgi:hypothetical protein
MLNIVGCVKHLPQCPLSPPFILVAVIDGVGFDAAELAQDIQGHLAVSHRAVA